MLQNSWFDRGAEVEAKRTSIQDPECDGVAMKKAGSESMSIRPSTLGSLYCSSCVVTRETTCSY
jgi:hypothetical protein